MQPVFLYENSVIVAHIQRTSLQVGHIRETKALWRNQTCSVISELQNRHTCMTVVKRRPHGMNRNMQQNGANRPNNAGMAKQRHALLIIFRNSKHSAFLLVTELLQKYVNVPFQQR